MARWRVGERLDEVIEEACRRYAERTAVAIEGADIAYREFDARANQMARLFIQNGVRPGDRVAVLLDRGLEGYVALFALLKARAVYVPLDVNYPPERIRHVLTDANASLIAAHLRLADRLRRLRNSPVHSRQGALRARRAGRRAACARTSALRPPTRSATSSIPRARPASPRASPSRIRASAISCASRASSMALARASASIRACRSPSISRSRNCGFPWSPARRSFPTPTSTSLFGEDLADFLESRGVTCFCCVPTLLASIDRDLPQLRILMIGGEVCPPALVKRWSRPGRTLFNSYGPTETTVTATLGRVSPDKPVTIGRPLPTYSIVILDLAARRGGRAGRSGRNRHRRRRRSPRAISIGPN